MASSCSPALTTPGSGTVNDHLRRVCGQLECVAEIRYIRQVEVAPTYYRYLFASTVDSGSIRGIHVVDRGEVSWRKSMRPGRCRKFRRKAMTRLKTFSGEENLRGFVEIVERLYPSNYRRERGGNLRVRGVGPVALAIHDVRVNFRVEGGLELDGGAGEFDGAAAVGDFVDLETLRLEPGDDGLNVGVGGAELLSELLRREPLVVIGGGFVLLLIEQGFESRFLSGAALQDEQHAVEREAGWGGAAVEFGARERTDVALQDDEILCVDRLRDARGNGSLLGSGKRHEQKECGGPSRRAKKSAEQAALRQKCHGAG